MAGKKRCFATVRALRRLDAALLCEVLRKFPEYLAERGLSVPGSRLSGADSDHGAHEGRKGAAKGRCTLTPPSPLEGEGAGSLDYEGIRDACMAGDVPHELDDVLFYVSMLGNKEGCPHEQRTETGRVQG